MGFLREPSHLVIVALVVLVLFGGKKLPEAARGLGRSMRIFKSEIKEMHEDDKPSASEPVEGRIVGDQAGAARNQDPIESPQPVHQPGEPRHGA